MLIVVAGEAVLSMRLVEGEEVEAKGWQRLEVALIRADAALETIERVHSGFWDAISIAWASVTGDFVPLERVSVFFIIILFVSFCSFRISCLVCFPSAFLRDRRLGRTRCERHKWGQSSFARVLSTPKRKNTSSSSSISKFVVFKARRHPCTQSATGLAVMRIAFGMRAPNSERHSVE